MNGNTEPLAGEPGEQRIADPAVQPRHRPRQDPAASRREPAALDQIEALPQPGDEPGRLAEVVARIGVGHDHEPAAGRGDPSEQRAAVAARGHRHDARPAILGDLARGVDAAVVGHDDLSGDPGGGERALRLFDAGSQGFGLVEARDDDRQLERRGARHENRLQCSPISLAAASETRCEPTAVARRARPPGTSSQPVVLVDPLCGPAGRSPRRRVRGRTRSPAAARARSAAGGARTSSASTAGSLPAVRYPGRYSMWRIGLGRDDRKLRISPSGKTTSPRRRPFPRESRRRAARAPARSPARRGKHAAGARPRARASIAAYCQSRPAKARTTSAPTAHRSAAGEAAALLGAAPPGDRERAAGRPRRRGRRAAADRRRPSRRCETAGGSRGRGRESRTPPAPRAGEPRRRRRPTTSAARAQQRSRAVEDRAARAAGDRRHSQDREHDAERAQQRRAALAPGRRASSATSRKIPVHIAAE